MIKSLSETCPAGQHWSDQFGGCATDSTTSTPAPGDDIFTTIGRNPVIWVGVGLFVIMLLRGDAKRFL
jgi:hypothetical protein